MRSKNGDYTPREAAIVIICGWIQAAMEEKTTDIELLDDRESFQAQLKSALEKEYRKLSARVNCIEEVA